MDADGNQCHKPIEEIKAGDMVWAYDEETGEQAYKPVKQLFRNTTKKWCTVSVLVGGVITEIVSTPGHKYYMPENTVCREVNEVQEHESYYELSEKWVSAQNLRKGDKVLLSDGNYGIIVSVKIEAFENPETTYKFEVEDFHTYFVGENSVCVHNNNCGPQEQWVETYDDAKQIAEQHVGTGASSYKGNSNIRVSNNGLKVARFDTNPNSAHVINKGPHINLETYQQPFGTKGGKPLINIHLRWRS